MDPQETNNELQVEGEQSPETQASRAVPIARDRLKVVIELNGLNGVIGVMVPDTTDAFVVVYHFDVLEVEGGYMEYLLAQVAEVVERALEYWSSQPKHPAYVMPARPAPSRPATTGRVTPRVTPAPRVPDPEPEVEQTKLF